jgi:hypothetical protein
MTILAWVVVVISKRFPEIQIKTAVATARRALNCALPKPGEMRGECIQFPEVCKSCNPSRPDFQRLLMEIPRPEVRVRNNVSRLGSITLEACHNNGPP